MSGTSRPRICVVGAGITGLAAAWEVRRSAPEADLVVLEAAERAGGVIRTSQFAGHPVDEGADAFLARVDDGFELCAELGLAGDLVAPATGRAFVHLDGELVPLPPAHFLGVPLDPDGLDARLLSPAGRAALHADLARGAPPACGSPATGRRDLAEPVASGRVAATSETCDRAEPPGRNQRDLTEPVAAGPVAATSGSGDRVEPPGNGHRDVPAPGAIGSGNPGADCSIGELIRSRLGDEVLERLVGPLVGAVNAGDCDRLSLQAAAPALAEAAGGHPSLIRALRERAAARRTGGAADGPVFWGLRGGMERLTATLAERLAPALALGEPALAVRVRPGAAGEPEVRAVDTPDRSIPCDALVLAVGAGPCAHLVEPWAPAVAARLERTGTASVAIVTLGYEASAATGATAGSGFVVPAPSGPGITACSWASTKWAHLGAPEGTGAGATAILRVSLGRHGDDDVVRGTDAALVAAARAGLQATMGITAAPTEVRISRWPDAFPQYAVGHVERTAAVTEALGAAGVFCAGSAFGGIGIPACIAGGRRAARAAVQRARHRSPS